ncbi:hypothetical protein D3C77_450120 [compost metagenome]
MLEAIVVRSLCFHSIGFYSKELCEIHTARCTPGKHQIEFLIIESLPCSLERTDQRTDRLNPWHLRLMFGFVLVCHLFALSADGNLQQIRGLA